MFTINTVWKCGKVDHGCDGCGKSYARIGSADNERQQALYIYIMYMLYYSYTIFSNNRHSKTFLLSTLG